MDRSFVSSPVPIADPLRVAMFTDVQLPRPVVSVPVRPVVASSLALLLLLLALPLEGIAQPRVEAERSVVEGVERASTLIDRGEYLRAIDLLNQTVDSAAPGADISSALFLLVEANSEVDRNYPALDAARRFLLLYPNDPRAGEMTYQRGVVAWREGKWEEAHESFQRIVRLKGDRSGASFYWLARMRAERGDLDTAEMLVDRSLSKREHAFTDDALYLSAWINESMGEYEIAAERYRKVVEEYPESDLRTDAQLRLGVNQARNGYHESALTLFTSLSPSTPRQQEELLFYSAESHAALGHHDRAVPIYKEFLRTFPSSPRNRAVRYALGWSELQSGEYDGALTSFQTISGGTDSLAAAALYQIGAIHLGRGDTASALLSLKEIVDRLPYESFSDNAHYQLGKIYYRRGAWADARFHLVTTARGFPGSDVRIEAFHLLGETYAVMKENDNAIYAFSRVRKLGDSTSPLVARATWREGMTLYRVGRFSSAINRLRSYVSTWPKGEDIASATFWLAEALYQNGMYAEAEQYYAEFVERYPKGRYRPESMFGLGWAQFRQKKFEQAITSFDAFVEAYPDRSEAIDAVIRMADSYRFLRKYKEAIATYELVGGRAGAGPRAEEARVRLAEAFVEMEEFERAVAVYTDLVERYPESERVDDYAWAIGATWYRGANDSLAIIELERFLREYKTSENRGRAQVMLGESWYNLGEYETALAWYRRVLDENPESPSVPAALDGIRFSLESMGRGPEAIAIIENFVESNPNRLAPDSITFNKGMIYFDNGEYDQADSIFRALIKGYPESGLLADAAYQIGKGREYRGDYAGAIVSYESVVSAYPSSSATALALADMGELKLFRKEYGGARENFLLLVERFPESSLRNQARYGAGRASVLLGDTGVAELLFRRVVDSASGLGSDLYIDRSRISLAEIAWAQDSTDEALDLLASVVSRRRDYTAAEALLLRGKILVAVNDLSAALAELRRLTDDFTDYPRYYGPGLIELGKLYELLTDDARAREVYRRAIDELEDAGLVAEAKRLLER